MIKRIWISWLLLALFVCTLYAGYTAGREQNNHSKINNDTLSTVHLNWGNEAEPPLPEISIHDITIEAALSSYSWCAPYLSNEGSCRSVSASISQLNTTTVPANAKIAVKVPQGVKTFTVTNSTIGSKGDPYSVPAIKGVYQYSVHCEWLLDQGKSDYIFSIEVV